MSAAAAARERAPGGRSVTVVRTREGAEALRSAWLSLRPARVTADPDYFLAALDGDPKIVRPHLVLLESDGRPECMAVARLEELKLPFRIGYRTVYEPRVCALTVVVGGLLGDPDEEQFELLLDELRRALDEGEADVLILSYLPLDSPEFRIASTRPPFLSRQHVVRSGIRWELDLPGSVDEYLRTKSAKHRQTLKRRRNKLERDFAGRLEIREYRDAADLDEFITAAAAVSAKTYQHALGVAFGDTPAHRLRTRVAMERGWFRGWILYLDGEPAAFWHGERYAGLFRTGNPGFDPAYDAYGIGTYLLLRAVDELCRDPEVRAVDHGVGDATYKQRYGTRSIAESNVFVFAKTFRGVRLNAALTLFSRLSSAVRAVAQRTGVLARAKSRWRRRLGSPAQR